MARSVMQLLSRVFHPLIKKYYFEHAERNSLYQCAYHGIRAAGTTMYTQGIPCADCARAIIQSGVSEVVIHQQWPAVCSPAWETSCKHSKRMLEEAGVNLRIWDGKLDVKGLADGKLIEV